MLRAITLAVTLTLLPGVCLAWGTLTDQLPMTADEEDRLRTLIDWYGGSNKARSLSEIVPRRGPHPTHQFIVRQAYMLLEKDPAYADSPWKLPALESVLAWDGIVRETGAGGRLAGMWARRSAGTGVAAGLAPPLGPIRGPSADAEITADGKWNPEYVAANHYWNPWLKCGSAPTAVGSCYIDMVKSMITGRDENATAKAASHLGHYLSDAICPKHADMIALKERDLKELSRIANAWFAEHDTTPTLRLSPWLESRRIDEALNVIIKASGAPRNSPYWQRVEAHITDTPLLTSNTSWVRYTVDIAEPSLRASVAGFLAALHDRPADKNLLRFYGFFDPFYYNGQLIMAYEKKGDWTPRSLPQFGLVTPGSEHLMWESNPAQANYVAGNMEKMIRDEPLNLSYVALPAVKGQWSTNGKERYAACKNAMAELVRKAGLEQHGKDPMKGDDFKRASYEDSLKLSVKYLFSALRASITAIRCDATYAHFPEEKKFRIYCDIGNVADDSLSVKALRVSIARDGKLYSSQAWVKPFSCSVKKDAQQRVVVEIPQDKITEKEPQFYVDIHGQYDKTPDLGFWRGAVSQRPPRIVQGMSLPAFDGVDGPLDLIICFDVTASMGSSLNSMRDNAIDVLGKLKARLGDMRVALVSFRDIKRDKEDAFEVTPFTSDINAVIARMKTWKPSGGGDSPEDQLEAIRLGLDMWGKAKSSSRKPTKIVVVITDAPPHDPDIKGNTQASIADYAERVDPAHVYPIIVGNSKSAHAKAEALADMTGGEVLTAKSGEEVASVLAAAVDKAVATHGEGAGSRVPPWLLFYGGLASTAGGILWTWRGRRKRS